MRNPFLWFIVEVDHLLSGLHCMLSTPKFFRMVPKAPIRYIQTPDPSSTFQICQCWLILDPPWLKELCRCKLEEFEFTLGGGYLFGQDVYNACDFFPVLLRNECIYRCKLGEFEFTLGGGLSLIMDILEFFFSHPLSMTFQLLQS